MKNCPKTFPDIDVVIPVYGRPKLSKEALQSVLKQDYPGRINIYIAEDHFPNYSKTLCINHIASLQKYYSNRYIYHIRYTKNRGPAATRNLAAFTGTAPFLAFLDSDDLWMPQKLSRQIDYLIQNKKSQWVHTNEQWFRNNIPVKQKARHRKMGGFFLNESFERCLISPSSVLLRRIFYAKLGGFQESFIVAEDYEMWLRGLIAADIGYLPEPLTIKRAGNWPQLSSRTEIDRYRVLALHRFARDHRNSGDLRISWPIFFEAAIKKINYLIKGAIKYNHAVNIRRYRSWLAAFTRMRTRSILLASEGTSKNSLP